MNVKRALDLPDPLEWVDFVDTGSKMTVVVE